MIQEAKIELNSVVKIPTNLTTDPYNKRGQKGTVIKIENDTATVAFKNNETGLYQLDALEPSNI